MHSTGIAILGAGSAGLSALSEVRRSTDDFVIVNSGPWGTTCARVGCMPSKALIEAAWARGSAARLGRFGIAGAEHLRTDSAAVLERVRTLRDGFVAATEQGSTAGLATPQRISGHAHLLDAQHFEVNGERWKARQIILAPGSEPVLPADWAALGPQVLTTDTLFELPRLPSRMAVIGLGSIGIELAMALAALEVEVHAFARSASLGGCTDPEVGAAVRAALQARVASLHNEGEVQVQAGVGGLLRVSQGAHAVEVEAVLVAIGRRARLAGLGLERLGVPLDAQGRPPVDPHTLQVADLPLFLAGDALGRGGLLHEAADDGHIAGRNALRRLLDGAEAPLLRYCRRVPIAIQFTDPPLAQVGHRHAELDPATTVIGRVDFARQGRARTAERAHGMLRVYAQTGQGRLLGAELCAPGGEHLAHLLALAISRELTVYQLLAMPWYHPVLEEGLRTALRQIVRQLPDNGHDDLATCVRTGVAALE